MKCIEKILNIINFIFYQQIEQEQGTRPLNEEDDSDSSDDGSSYRDDGESSEEEEEGAGKAKTKELEWDDSTLNF